MQRALRQKRIRIEPIDRLPSADHYEADISPQGQVRIFEDGKLRLKFNPIVTKQGIIVLRSGNAIVDPKGFAHNWQSMIPCLDKIGVTALGQSAFQQLLSLEKKP